MTQPQCVELLRELHALERLEAAITARHDLAAAFDWRCALTAIRDRLQWLRYCCSQEDPAALAAANDLEAHDHRCRSVTMVPSEPVRAVDAFTADVPKDSRIH